MHIKGRASMPYGISDLLNDLFSRFPVSIGPYCGTDFVIAVIDGVRLKTNHLHIQIYKSSYFPVPIPHIRKPLILRLDLVFHMV